MPASRPFRWLLLLAGGFAVAGGPLAARAASDAPSSAPASSTPAPKWDIFRFVDELPETIGDLLPHDQPSGAVRLYLRPRYGDLIRRDYLRVPAGVRLQVTDNLAVTTELQSYFTHGLGDSAGYGLSGLLLGARCEHVLPALNQGGFSVGVNYTSPLSRPPQDLTDGHRHLLPYIAATRPLLARWKLLGYASFGADFLEHTAMPAHFGQNELHANSLVATGGAAREWSRFRVALTATLASTAFVSDERRQVFSLQPEVVLPLRPATATTQVLLTLSGHAVWGPGGQELGLSSSVRIESLLAGKHR